MVRRRLYFEMPPKLSGIFIGIAKCVLRQTIIEHPVARWYSINYIEMSIYPKQWLPCNE